MEIAKNLDDLYRVCDPERPLSATDERYVDLADARGVKNLAATIARRISRTTASGDYHQQLVTGHRGCGKSTELLRLQAVLEEKNFFTIYLDVEEMLDLVDVDYLDVLLAIAQKVEQEARDNEFSLNEGLLDDVYQWFAERIIVHEQQQDEAADLQMEAETGLKIPLLGGLLARLSAETKTASSNRSIIRRELQRQLPVFIEKLNTLINEARRRAQQKKKHQDLVIIVDGLEKMHYRMLDDSQSSHAMLFLHHAEQLKAPQCHLVYTVPISLAFSANLSSVFDMFVMPMVKVFSKNDDEHEDGVNRLMEIIRQRADINAVFEAPELLKKLVTHSGGVVRDLMHLIRMASDTDKDKISQPEADYACQTLTKDYDRMLRNQDIEAMYFVRQEKRVQADESFARLLYLRVILEYENGERWADLHPAVTHIPWVKKKLA